MQREIKFRGKRIDTGGELEGDTRGNSYDEIINEIFKWHKLSEKIPFDNEECLLKFNINGVFIYHEGFYDVKSKSFKETKTNFSYNMDAIQGWRSLYIEFYGKRIKTA